MIWLTVTLWQDDYARQTDEYALLCGSPQTSAPKKGVIWKRLQASYRGK